MTGAAPGFAGFYGKLPVRGDFVRSGLPGDAVDALDGWARAALAASRAALGEDWMPCWMEAPVWRFALAPGVAGVSGLGGVWLPSMDQVGRCFPLIIAAEISGAGAAWLDAAEALGFEAVTADLAPEALAARLAAVPPAPGDIPRAGGVWWTEGAPRKDAARIETDGLPDPADFLGLLADAAAIRVP
ncbi:type VI secretion system-associated protein TagF [Acidiphilium sp. AL]|uniref:Type VI secretion system-associated protein TagF n=1 Tax=Acidiphilium iwatense TaxID=768198 RepID=A0ABS9E0M2_9PROT|nr:MULTISPECIES: type VI secretion system-associated protein TagF [Acidiphilium]MCF3948493.1 type VI secretion system-associated protein TagF [Acidiphilium iwatense]MCU4161240.1 type VI secretion system-associated protein TagF [Acidiphilium sp. AL]